jgi:hypothetical protein
MLANLPRSERSSFAFESGAPIRVRSFGENTSGAPGTGLLHRRLKWKLKIGAPQGKGGKERL